MINQPTAPLEPAPFDFQTPDEIEKKMKEVDAALPENWPDHWQTGCSNAARWTNCPGSKYAVDDREPGYMAELGTLGHKVTEQMLRHRFEGYKTKPIIDLTDEDRAIIKEIDATQLDWFKTAIKMCCEAVVELTKPYSSLSRELIKETSVILFEKKLKSKVVPDHGGKSDVILWFEDLELLTVIDFKFGSIGVDCKDNEQIMCYLNLARQLFPKAKKFHGVIVQPSYNGVDHQKFTRRKLNDFRAKAVVAADPGNMERHGDPAWCEYCPLLATCDAAAKMNVSAVDEFGTLPELINEVDEWTPARIERLERIVLMHKLAKTAYDSASALLKQLHADGHELNYHRVTSSKDRSW